jgi:hypothetical protein
MNQPLWMHYSIVIMYLVVATLSWCSREFRKEFVIPWLALTAAAQFTVGAIVSALVIIYRTFYQ